MTDHEKLDQAWKRFTERMQDIRARIVKTMDAEEEKQAAKKMHAIRNQLHGSV